MTAPRVLQYKVGDVTTSGEKIVFIYGHSPSVVVFKDGNGKIQWETAADVLSSTESAVHQQYDRLHSRLRSCLPEGAKRDQLIEELAHALFLGLSEPLEEKALRHFEHAAGRIAQEAQIEARFTYLVAGSVAAGIVFVLGAGASALTPNADVKAILLGATSAAVGAWTSVLSRAPRLELGPFETPAHLRFQGVTRILLGMTFGIVVTVGMKSGQLFPAASGSFWSTAFTTFLSGWSERLVPEIISKIESRDAKASLKGPSAGTA